ncbi:hypothetical protein ACFU1Q_11365 [Brachybacterium paraconglomeratum]
MNDKTLGAYKRTTPDPDETTGEALARLAAELTRLLDEVDAELRDEADGGVAAALIEKEAEQRACPDLDAHWRLDEAQETIQRLTQERDEVLAGVRELARQNIECHERATAGCGHPNHGSRGHDCTPFLPVAEACPLTPDAITDQIVDYVHEDYFWSTSDRVRLEKPALKHALLDAVKRLAEASARPEGAEEIERLIETSPWHLAGSCSAEADWLAEEFAALWKETTREHVGRARTAHSYADAARVAHADVLTRAEKAEQERDEALRTLKEVLDSHDETLREIAEGKYAAESRPLTPDAIDDEMVRRAKAELEARAGGDYYPETIEAVLTAALTEPPARPEGAEEIERLLMDADRDGGEVYRTDGYTRLADYLAEGLSKGGVRVVGEDGAA